MPSLVAQWDFTNVAGATSADNVSGRLATLDGAGASWDTTAQDLALDGSGAYAAVVDDPAFTLSDSDFTIAMTATWTTGADGMLLSHDEGPGSVNKWIFGLGVQTSGYLQFHINSPTLGNGVNPIDYAWNPTAGIAYHIAVSRSSDVWSLSIDNEVVQTNTLAVLIADPDAPLTIGTAEALATFAGHLDDVAIYVRFTPEELYATHLAVVAEADETYLAALQSASEMRDISSDLSDGDYYRDADQLYADYQAAISDAESAYDAAHVAADAAYQDAIAAADSARSARSDAAETVYDAALGVADAAWDQAMQAAASVYDAALAAADADYPVGLLQAARDQADVASQSTAATLTTAETDLTNAITAATTTRDQAIADADAAIDYYFMQAAIDQVGATMVANALLAYNAELDAANTAYDALVEPFQTAWGQAYADYSNNPDDPELQSALNDADDALNAAIDQAGAERTAAQTAAQTTYDNAVASAAQFVFNEQTAAVQTWQDALAAAAAAYIAAVAPYQTARDDADAANQSAQATLASAAQAVTEAETQSTAAYASAVADRQAAELAADQGYDLLADAAFTLLQAEEDAAQLEFDTAGQAAWDVYQPLEDAALAAYNTAEESAWAAYEAGLANLQTNWQTEQDAAVADYDIARAAATTVWHTAEQTAWDVYTVALADDPTAPPPDVRDTEPPAEPVADDNADEWADFDDSDAPPPADDEWTWDDEDPDEPTEPVSADDGPEFPELHPLPEDMDGPWPHQDEWPAAPWESFTSPFYASTLEEAKYRAYLPAWRAGAGNATAIGAAVAAEFEVDAALTWGAFFPAADWNDFVRERNRAANALDPALIAALDADWQQTPAGTTSDNPIGEDIAARWSRVPGFSWVAPETGWAELYTAQADRRLRELRAAPIPRITASASGWAENYALRQYDDLASDYLAVQMEAVVRRLRYASAAEVAAYVSQPGGYGLDVGLTLLMRQASRLLVPSATPEVRARAQETLLICQSIYSEMHSYLDVAKYGLHDNNARTFSEIVAGFRSVVAANPMGSQPVLDWANYRSTLAKRVAFLADTSYETFVGRERLAIDLQFGAAPPTEAEQRARNWQISLIPTAHLFYFARQKLIAAMAVDVYVSERIGSRGYQPLEDLERYWNSSTSARRALSESFMYLYDRYIRGGIAPGTPRLSRSNMWMANEADFFTRDRFNLVNMAAPLLTADPNEWTTSTSFSWSNASDDDKSFFANTIHPMDRSVLINSLYALGIELRRAGADAQADIAADMREYLTRRFNKQMDSVQGPLLEQVFTYASRGQYVLHGNTEFTPEEVAAYQQMPESVRRLASVMATESFREWRARNPVRVTYQPAFGDEYIDRAVLNAAEMLSPVFRYAQRRVFRDRDEWGDLDAIRAIMSGNYNVTLGPSALNYGVWAQIGDTLLTAATIIPIGAGATATRHLVMFTAGGLTASFAMAAVEVAPIDEASRGPLRFLAGLAAGITGGALGNAGLNIGQRLGRSATLVVRTRQLAAARTQLLELEGQMRAAVSPGSTVPSALVNRYATLTTQIERLENQIGTLRGLGGQVLRDAETALTNRMREMADLEGRAAAPGLSPAARQALLRGDAMRQARQRLSDATRTLDEAYFAVDRADFLRGVRPLATDQSANLLTNPGSVSNWSHTADINRIAAGLEDLLRVFAAHRGTGSAFRIHPTAYQAIRTRLAESGNQRLLSLLEEMAEVTEDLHLSSGLRGGVNYSARTIEISASGRVGTLYEELTHFRDVMIFESRGFTPRLGKLGLSSQHQAMAQELQGRYTSLWGQAVTGTDAAIIRRLFEDLAHKQMIDALEFFIR